MSGPVRAASLPKPAAPQQQSQSVPKFTRIAARNGEALQRKCACGNSTSGGANCEECEKKKALQRKAANAEAVPENNAADEARYEVEADRVANEVLSLPSPPSVNVSPATLARPTIQRRRSNGDSSLDDVPGAVDSVLSKPGQALDATTRRYFEPRFGHDFSRVRVHVDDTAANAVDAHAFTVGHHVVFNTNQYRPGSESGRRLLAHELTHVVQQGAVDGSTSPNAASLSRKAASVLQRKPKAPYPAKVRSVEQIKDKGKKDKAFADQYTNVGKPDTARVCPSSNTTPTSTNCPDTVAAGDEVTVTKDLGGWVQLENTGFSHLGTKPPGYMLDVFIEPKEEPKPPAASKPLIASIPSWISVQQPPAQPSLPLIVDAEKPKLDYDAVAKKALEKGFETLTGPEADVLLQHFGGKAAGDKLIQGLPPPAQFTFQVPGDASTVPLQLDARRKENPFLISPWAEFQITPDIASFLNPGPKTTTVTVDSQPQQTKKRQEMQSAPTTAAILSPYFSKDTPDETLNPTTENAQRITGIYQRLMALKPEDRKTFDAQSMGQMTSWDEFDQKLTDFIKPIEMADRKKRDKVQAVGKAKKLIDDATTADVLDDAQLGRDLYQFAHSGETATVLAAFNGVGWSSRDNVAVEFVKAAGESGLDVLAGSADGKNVLARVYDELTSGNLGADDKEQAEKVLMARARTIDPKQFVNAASKAMVIPFSGVGFTKLSSASIDATLLPNGKLRVKTYMKVDHWKKAKRMPSQGFALGLDAIEIDPDQVVGLYLYDEGGKTIYVPALYLLLLSNQEDTKLGSMAAEAVVTGFTLGLGGEATAAGEGAEAVDKSAKAIWLARGASVLKWGDRIVTVLSVASTLINEHRGLILEKFGEDGETFLRHWQTVDTVIAIYGIGRGAIALGETVVGLRKSFNKWNERRAQLQNLEKEEAAALDQVAAKTEESIKELEDAQASSAGRKAPPTPADAAAADEPVLAARAAADGHEVEITPTAVKVCSPPPCPVLDVAYAAELKAAPELVTELDEVKKLRETDPEKAAERAAALQAKLEDVRTKFAQKPSGATAPSNATPDPIDEKIAETQKDLNESRRKLTDYKDQRASEGLSLKGGPSKGVWNAKERLWLLRRQKIYPKRQMLEQVTIVGVKDSTGTLKTAKSFGQQGRILDFAEVNGAQVTAGDLKSADELMGSVKGGVKKGPIEGTIKPKSKLGQQIVKEDALVNDATANKGKLVLQGTDVRTGESVTIEVEPSNFDSTVVTYDDLGGN